MSEDTSSDEDILVVEKKPLNRLSDSDSDEVSFKDAKSSTMNEHAIVSQMADETSEILISEDEDDEKSVNSIFPNKKSDISWSTSDGGSKQIISDDDDDSYEKSMAFRTPQRTKPIIDDSDDDKDSTKDHSTDEDSNIVEDSFEDDEKVESTILKEKSMIKSSSNHFNRQPTLDSFVHKFPKAIEVLEETDDKIECSRAEYNTQMNKIKELEGQMLKIKTLISSIKLANLPDKGQSLKDRFESYKSTFLSAQERLRNMVIATDEAPAEELHGKAALTQNWANIEAGIAAVLPKTFGKRGLENHNAERALTAERLVQLHGSLKNCPDDEQLAEDPVGLKVTLKSHQKRALAWMTYRERQKPKGGILADDMGLGKTLTLLSLLLANNQKPKENDEKEEDEDDEESSKKHTKYKGGTLVVCPASLLHQWSGEIESKMKRGMLSWEIYHGPKREVKAKRLAKHDVVITTYSIAMHEYENEGPIFRVRWNRIILDEAHQIRNHKSKTSIACCQLAGINRWALTGTPVHNKELDMYALLKFLRCSPFDDLAVWKRWVTDKNSGGGERLNTVISTLMLRRTKTELMEQGKLTGMPSRKWDLVVVELDEGETTLYQKVLMFSQTLFAEFLHQHAEKTQDRINLRTPNANPNGEYFKMRQKLLRMNKMTEISQHDILVLLLRLRQICCHPFLITGMLQGDEDLGEGEPEETEEFNVLEQLNKLNLDENEEDNDFAERIGGLSDKPVGMREAAKGILNPSHPVFARERMSSKIKSMLSFIEKILPSGDKIIIVSQWTKFLELVELHLDDKGVMCLSLNGNVPTAKRNDIVTAFNNPSSEVKILLLSLTAGGVGLNLIGANHLFLIDLHWNPQLENQAQDRIYRMGQKKNVNVYKFMTTGTIEERIKKLQENKLMIAENLISGSKQVVGNKLTLQDMKMLFNM